MADMITTQGWARVQQNITQLEEGAYNNLDLQYSEVAGQVFKAKGYPLEHPLARNIW